MSPRRSNTICRPSGLTSTFIQVPSEVSKVSFWVGPRSALTSHFLTSACCARGCANVASITPPTRADIVRIRFMVSAFCLLPLLILEASPQVPARHGAIRPPGFADFSNPIRVGFLPEPIKTLDGRHDAQVVHRQDVWPAETEHQNCLLYTSDAADDL